ncbi:hypothetical protein H5410_062568 [Solanum commersonii]|uniref:Uncharacterized protein n=1 Tax=Solanum commersonii TaxID=4109 RepID=A0A9J5WB63_SOLCO|nr:hypothetical protein H5410_062568 [Solanum commersonii]
MKSKKESDNNPPAYSTVLMNEENTEVFDLNDKREVILLLENSDLRWKNDPWQVAGDLSPFKQITRKLQMKKDLISKSEAIAIYMEEVKKDLMKNLDIDIKNDISMAYASHTNEDDDATCLAGEGQDSDNNEEVDIDALFKKIQEQVEESSNTATAVKGKNKINQLRLRSDIIYPGIVMKVRRRNLLDPRYLDVATSEPQGIDDLSLFKQIARKLHMKKGLVSKSEAIALYMDEVKKYLIKNLGIEIKEDVSMVSADHTNDSEDTLCMAGEAQNDDSNEEIDIDALLQKFQERVEESSSNTTAYKGKGKA